ncbi:MAG TPA: phosphatase domain-containing protein [Thermoanaerobaculia bacterium]|nr:phosphatase domain-containing protein [Thermoanaerobaculia bacterium]
MEEDREDDRNEVLNLLSRIEGSFDRVKQRLADRFDRDDPIQILPYRGFGTPELLRIQGRVLQDEPIRPASQQDRALRNLGNIWKRLESDEVPGMAVRAAFGDWTGETVTDEEGYFRFEIRPREPLAGAGRSWHEVRFEARDPRTGAPIEATGSALVPPPGVSFGIISDVDDTIVETGVTNRLAMARTVLLRNAYTRLPFEGVAAFYQALHQGRDGDDRNPVFFVSGSPWNLYDLLAEFMRLQGIPEGPILLRDFGLSGRNLLRAETREYKLGCIRPIFDLYPELDFILIGDSGEQDPEIYRQVVREYPGRVRAIYIRNVGAGPARQAEVAALTREVWGEGIAMLLVKDTEAASVHAAENGWIRKEKLPEVREEKRKDQEAPSPAEAALSSPRSP